MNYLLRNAAIMIRRGIDRISVGCLEPNYRAMMRPTGQGGVEVHRLPKDDPAPSPSPNSPTISQSPLTTDQQIEALEADLRRKTLRSKD